MTNRKINHKEIEKLVVRCFIYSDICKGFLSQNQYDSVNWFFHDIHDRLAEMFRINLGRREFDNYFGEIFIEVKELSRRGGMI